MSRKAKFIIPVIALAIAAGLGHLGWSYYKMEQDTQRRASMQVDPRMDSGHIREIGYILDMKVTQKLSDKRKEIMWWVKVPTTDAVYSCSWECGFHGFIKYEGVVLIHVPTDTDTGDWTGYIIGLHGQNKGKSALVWALDVEDVTMLQDLN